jgi:flagellar biosynthetic protein FliQ
MDTGTVLLEAITTAALASALPLAASLIVGTAVALFQAVTQLHDQTLSFVPKIAAVSLVLLFFGDRIADSVLEQFRLNLTLGITEAARTR